MQKALHFWHAVCTKCNAFYVVLQMQLRKQCTSDTWIAQNAMCSTIYDIKNGERTAFLMHGLHELQCVMPFMALSWRTHCMLGMCIAWHAMCVAFFYRSKMEKGLRFRHMERALVHHGFEPWLRTKEHHSFESWFAIASGHWLPTMNLYEAQCVLSFMAF